MIGDYATGTIPYGVAFDGQHIWVSNTGSNNLTKRVAANGASAGTFSLGAGASPKGIAFDGASLWVANSGNNTVSKVDLNGTVLGTFAAGTTPTDVVSDGTNIWVANRGSNNISKLSKTGALLGTYAVGVEPISLVYDGTHIWTANYGNKTVSRIKTIDGATNNFQIPAMNPMGLAFDGRHVWIGDYYGWQVYVIRASDGVLVGTVNVDDNPQGLVFDGDNVWAALFTMGLTKLPAPAFQMTFSAGALNSGAVTTEKVADGAVTAAKLNINDNIRLNDKNLYLRGGSDTNHGLGWYGSGKSFGGSTLDGPALYGFTGGVLGTTSGGEKIALSWDLNKNVTFGSHLYLNGILNLDTAAKIQANGRDLYLAWDELHGLGWYGATKNFSATNVNGPVLYGFAGGALGTTNGGQKIALSWDSNKNVTAAANLTVAGSQTLTGNLSLSGSLNLDSSTAKIQLKDKDLYISYDALHGLGWYGSGKTFNGYNVNGPVLFGNGGGALGIAPDGTTRRIAFQWHGDGSTRLHDNTLYLRGNGGDTAHGLGWFNNSAKPFMNNTESFDGPILYGAGGGALGTNGNPGRLVLKWYNDGRVVIPGNLSKGSGSFKIDHPLDPTGKYLYHSFVESPDMMNIYNGVTVTDARGYVTIELPDWFEALNRDFRYQLTVIDEEDGADFIQAKVVKEVGGNRFTIRSSVPRAKISWQVTGIRKDPYAEAHRIPVEEAKPASEQGSCLHQEACR